MGTPSSTSSSDGADSADRTTDTERAVHGTGSLGELQSFLNAYAWDRLGSPIAKVRFRAGRIDAVWGVELDDGRAVVIKGHRPPADIDAIAAARDAQRLLTAANFRVRSRCRVPTRSMGASSLPRSCWPARSQMDEIRSIVDCWLQVSPGTSICFAVDPTLSTERVGAVLVSLPGRSLARAP